MAAVKRNPGASRGLGARGVGPSGRWSTRPLRIPVTIGYHVALLTAGGDVAFTLSEFAIPIPRFLWIVLDDRVTVRFRTGATRSE